MLFKIKRQQSENYSLLKPKMPLSDTANAKNS